MESYYNEVFDYVNKLHPLSDSVFRKLYESAAIITLKPKEKLLKRGVVPRKFYFITEGVVRSYTNIGNGKDLTTSLQHPFSFFGPYKALLRNEPSDIVFVALTHCVVYEFDFLKVYEFCSKDIDLMTLYSKILAKQVLLCEARFFELSHKEAVDRYLALCKREPGIENKIPQYQIAASLGITPVQLSRIRTKLKQAELVI